jgi:anti-sigma regulatory factor (Ser/Thr protein kinase)
VYVQIAAKVETLEVLHQALDRFYGCLILIAPDPPTIDWWASFYTAVVEVGNNVVRHAYPSPHEPEDLTLTIRFHDDRAEAVLIDRGVAFYDEPARTSVNHDDISQIPERGYGLTIARACVDTVDYHRSVEGENHWTIIKRLAA